MLMWFQPGNSATVELQVNRSICLQRSSVITFFLAVLSSCSSPPPTTDGTACAVGESCPCIISQDCPDSAVEYCDIASGVCLSLTPQDATDDDSDGGIDDVHDTESDANDQGTGESIEESDVPVDEGRDPDLENDDDTGEHDDTSEDVIDIAEDAPHDLDTEDTATDPDAEHEGPNPWIAFNVDPLRDDDGNEPYQIDLIRADGTGRVRFSEGNVLDLHPAWSPDGTQLAFSRLDLDDNVTSLVIHDFEDGTAHVVETSLERVVAPSWSPDGSTIAVEGKVSIGDEPDIWLIGNLPTGTDEPVQLTTHGGKDSWPIWAPTGDHLYFTSDRSGAHRIYEVDADGTDLAKVFDAAVVGGLSITSDGATLIYATNDALVFRSLETGLSRSLRDYSEPSLFNDGSRLAVSWNTGGQIDLYVVDVSTGREIQQLTDEADIAGSSSVSSIESAEIDLVF